MTAPVGSFPANAWGLFDMHGNVWEWCQDWHGEYPDGTVTDPTGPASGRSRVLRGGCWYTPKYHHRSATRGRGAPDLMNLQRGFRVVAEASDGVD
jgi:formylglycine-generating enzyme required for sulfatase activity